MEGATKEDIKERLLPKNRTGSEEEPAEFKSWISEDDEDIDEVKSKRGFTTGSLNSNGKLDNNEDEKKFPTEERKSEYNKLDPQPMSSVDTHSDNATNAPKSMNIGVYTKKRKKKTVWIEIFDFLVFCYEFILVMCVIGSGSILAAIPPSIYVFWSLLYLGLQIIIEKRGTTITIWTILMGVMLTTSVVFLVLKIVFAILIRTNSLTYNRRVHLSLGIAVTNDEIDAWLVTKTFLADLVALIVSLLLFIGWIIKGRKVDDELGINKIEELKVTGARSPTFWIGVWIFFIAMAGIISPSIILFVFVGKFY